MVCALVRMIMMMRGEMRRETGRRRMSPSGMIRIGRRQRIEGDRVVVTVFRVVVSFLALLAVP